jgi:hypothetical protein
MSSQGYIYYVDQERVISLGTGCNNTAEKCSRSTGRSQALIQQIWIRGRGPGGIWVKSGLLGKVWILRRILNSVGVNRRRRMRWNKNVHGLRVRVRKFSVGFFFTALLSVLHFIGDLQKR